MIRTKIININQLYKTLLPFDECNLFFEEVCIGTTNNDNELVKISIKCIILEKKNTSKNHIHLMISFTYIKVNSEEKVPKPKGEWEQK